MALGGLIAVSDRRYRGQVHVKTGAAEAVAENA